MQFDKLIFRGANRAGRLIRVTVDFRIGEITAQSAPDGEVMWCRLAGHRGTVLRMKLDACDFGTWKDDDAMRDRGSSATDGITGDSPLSPPPSGTDTQCEQLGRQELEAAPAGWSLDLCSNGQAVKHLSGDDNATEQTNAFASLIDLCLSFAENRSVGQRVPLSPEPAF